MRLNVRTVRWTFFGKDVSDDPKMLKVMGWLLIGGSMVWLIAGAFMVVSMLLFLPGTQSAQGTILSCQFDKKGECSPTVRFVTQSGQTVTFPASESSTSYHQGDALSVRYHPNSPQDARIDDFVFVWLFPLLSGGGFLLFLFVGRYTLRRATRLREEQASFDALPSPFARELAGEEK